MGQYRGFDKKAVFLHIVGCIAGLSLLYGFRPDPHMQEKISQSVKKPMLAPPKDLRHFTFGYHESVADGLWLRVIQDIDYCEGGKISISQEESDRFNQMSEAEKIEVQRPNVLKSDPAQKVVREPKCRKGWVFRTLESIIELVPRFLSPYTVGGIVLSVVVDDREGAQAIFERGLKQYPKNWVIAYRAAYHALYEMDDAEKAAQLLTQAGRNGAPPWTFSLAAKLFSVAGRAEVARLVLLDALESDPNGPMAERIRQRLKELEMEASTGDKE